MLSLNQARGIQPSAGLTELVKPSEDGSGKKLIIFGGGGVCLVGK